MVIAAAGCWTLCHGSLGLVPLFHHVWRGRQQTNGSQNYLYYLSCKWTNCHSGCKRNDHHFQRWFISCRFLRGYDQTPPLIVNVSRRVPIGIGVLSHKYWWYLQESIPEHPTSWIHPHHSVVSEFADYHNLWSPLMPQFQKLDVPVKYHRAFVFADFLRSQSLTIVVKYAPLFHPRCHWTGCFCYGHYNGVYSLHFV